MKTRNLKLAVLAFVASTTLIGCGNELSTAPDANLESNGSLSSAVTASSGKALFEACEANAMATLSLSEVVQLTPFILGASTLETASLAEIVAITPTVVKFQAAFEAEIGSLSLADVVKVTRYMESTGKNRFPYPELDGSSKEAA